MSASQATESATGPLATFLDEQAQRSHEQLGDVAGVAVTVALRDKPITIGASSRLAREVDELQYAIGYGPCLHALSSGEGLYVADLAHDDRWDDYGPRAAKLGAACCLSLPVRTQLSPVGVFKVYSSRVDGLTADQQETGRLVALQLSSGVGLAHLLASQAEELDDRAAAMDQRRLIDLAVGIVMERHRCGAAEAFDRLRRQSNDTNTKLRDTAAAMLESLGPVPGPAPFRPKAR